MTTPQLIIAPLPFLQCVKYATAPKHSTSHRLYMIVQLAGVVLQESPPSPPTRPFLIRVLTSAAIACILPSACIINYFLSDTEEERHAALRELGMGFAAICTSCVAYRIMNYAPIKDSQEMLLARDILRRLTTFNVIIPNPEEEVVNFCKLIQRQLQYIPENESLSLLSQILPTTVIQPTTLFSLSMRGDTPVPENFEEETHYFDNLPSEIQELLTTLMRQEGLLGPEE